MEEKSESEESINAYPIGESKHKDNEFAKIEGHGLGLTGVPRDVTNKVGSVRHEPADHSEYVTLAGLDLKVTLHTYTKNL